MSDQDRLFDAAVSLSKDARISLIEKLLSSLHLPTAVEIDLAWAEEAEMRAAQIERGEVELVPGEEVFAKLREKYRK